MFLKKIFRLHFFKNDHLNFNGPICIWKRSAGNLFFTPFFLILKNVKIYKKLLIWKNRGFCMTLAIFSKIKINYSQIS